MSNSKQFIYDHTAWKFMQSGVNKLAKAVAVTLGPKGRNVVIDRGNTVHVTKDGVTVAKSIVLKDRFENMGAKMVKEVAAKANDEAGDGTTTATVLAQAIFNEGVKSISAGLNPSGVKRGIDQAVSDAIEMLKQMAIPCETHSSLCHVATVSANNDPEIGKLIADALEKSGKDGIVSIETGNGVEDAIVTVDGLQFDRGYISPYFASNTEDGTVVLDRPFIIIANRKISNIQDILGILEQISKAGRSLLVIAEDLDGEALASLVVNSLRGVIKCVAVKAPGFGDQRKDQLGDIAVLTGGKVIDDSTGVTFENFDGTELGEASQVVVTKENTTIIGGSADADAIANHVVKLKAIAENTESEYAVTKINERIAKLTGGVVVVKIGAATEAAMTEKKDRADDALCAIRAAREEGIVPGGGTALAKISQKLNASRELTDDLDYNAGYKIALTAMQAPIRWIAQNAAQSGDVIFANVVANSDENVGYNARTDRYVDMIEDGIIDPLKVTRLALTYAASVAGLMLTTACMITDDDTEETSKNSKAE